MYSQINKVNAYKKIAFNFLFLVLILLGFIVYFIFYKVDIAINPVKEKIDTEFIVEVQDSDNNTNSGDSFIGGTINQTEVEGSKEFSTTGTKNIFDSADGEVFIVNKASFNQPLVATTRLLTPDNVLFRIKSGVVVPAGGEVAVEIYPDDKNFNKIIKPTKLTIPGLSKSRQTLIYAENRSNIGTTKEIKVLSQEDINIAQENLKEDLYKQAREQFNLKNKNKLNINFMGKIPRINSIEQKNILTSNVDKKVGEETDKFNLSLKIKVVEVSFDENNAREMARKKILEIIPDDKEFIGMNNDSFNYILQDYNAKNKIARVKVYASGNMVISERSKFLDKDQFMGQGIDKVKDLISNSPAVKDLEITSPFNLLKFIPKNKNKINIKIITKQFNNS